jgi:hypothetical protein
MLLVETKNFLNAASQNLSLGKDIFFKKLLQPGTGAHACNPNYSGGSQFKASLGQQFMRLYLEKPLDKKGLVEWLKV